MDAEQCHIYLTMCAKGDDQVDKLISTLKDEGIYDYTAIIVLSDHGDYSTDFGSLEKMSELFFRLPCQCTIYYKTTKEYSC